MSAPFAKGGFMTTRSAFSAICSAVTCRKSPWITRLQGAPGAPSAKRAVDLDGQNMRGDVDGAQNVAGPRPTASSTRSPSLNAGQFDQCGRRWLLGLERACGARHNLYAGLEGLLDFHESAAIALWLLTL